MTYQKILFLTLVCISLLAAKALLPQKLASAAPLSITAGEVMALVNELRQSRGLQPYSIDPGITAYAQEHSEYQALTDTSTHLHSDGLVSLAHGYVENVAGGEIGYLTAYAVVYEIWSDPVHMKPMVGYESGSAGVGVASNSTTTFVTLNVRPGTSANVPSQANGTPATGDRYTPIALVPLRTATMKPSGAVIHEVGYGQTLWSIAVAYGVSGAQIRALNGMTPDDSSIWAGQKLLIIPAGLVTPTPPPAKANPAGIITATAIVRTPVAYLSSSPTGPTLTPLETVTGTPVLPDPAVAWRFKVDPVIAGLTVFTAAGLVLFLASSVRTNRRK